METSALYIYMAVFHLLCINYYNKAGPGEDRMLFIYVYEKVLSSPARLVHVNKRETAIYIYIYIWELPFC